MNTKLYHLIPRRLLTRVFYLLSRIETTWCKNLLIRIYQRVTGAKTDFAKEKDPLAYPSLNAFFTRELAENARVIEKEVKTLVSPVDGRCAIYQTLEQNTLLQAKGISYTADALLADASLATQFYNGETATLYLAPDDYHRIHAPMDCTLRAMRFCPGDKHSVALPLLSKIPNIFAGNERLVLEFDTAIGKMVMVWVGALNVASISTIWHGELRHQADNYYVYNTPMSFKKGEELGQFNLGSTVILFFEANTIRWEESALNAQRKLLMGEKIASIIHADS